jgi:hypothetical protein
MENYGELKRLGRFYGKTVYGYSNPVKGLDYLNSVRDWKLLQFRGEMEVEGDSPHECWMKLPSGDQFTSRSGGELGLIMIGFSRTGIKLLVNFYKVNIFQHEQRTSQLKKTRRFKEIEKLHVK